MPGLGHLRMTVTALSFALSFALSLVSFCGPLSLTWLFFVILSLSVSSGWRTRIIPQLLYLLTFHFHN